MSFTLPSLRFEPDALSPILSAESFVYHHGKHHAGVVAGSNELVAKIPALEGKTLEEVIRFATNNPEYEKLRFNASQHWNHSLYWLSLSTPGSTKPSHPVKNLIDSSFDGGMDGFKQAFLTSSLDRIGSGWVWLIYDGKRLSIESTINYDVPIDDNKSVLATCDVWEHTYYIDYRNNRKLFIEKFVDELLNWDGIESRLEKPNESLDRG